MENQIYIVLATYNGEIYLGEQIKSLQAQTLTDWTLLIRDDGSSDNTRKIIQHFTEQDNRIILFEDDLGNLGPARCFGCLMDEALQRGAEYLAFCDQDDYWIPEKLEQSLFRIQAIEAIEPKNIPILIHSDLIVVNDKLETIAKSYMVHQAIHCPFDPPLELLLIQNHVVGCTVFVNRALLALAVPFPEAAYMHDWWLAICANVAGRMWYNNLGTVKYRQHGVNSVGADGFTSAFKLGSGWWRRFRKMAILHDKALVQAQIAAERLADIPHKKTETFKALESFLHCTQKKWGVSRAICARRLRVKGQNWVITLLFYLFIMTRRSEYRK